MALTLEKTWQYDINNTLTGASQIAVQSALWIALKDAMVGFASNPWRVAYSCDGTTAGTAGDGVDRWADVGDVNYSTAASSAHSWIVLQNQVTDMEILIECLTTSTSTGKIVRLVVSAHAGFSGGSTTSSPSATDEREILAGTGSGTAAPTIGLGSGSSGTAPELVWDVRHSTDGEVTTIAIRQSNECVAFAYFGTASQPVTSWTNPLVAAWYATTSSPTPPTPAPLSWLAVWRTYLGSNGAGVHRCYGLNMPSAGAVGVPLHLIAPAVCTHNDNTESNPTSETTADHTAAQNDGEEAHEAPAIGLYSSTSGDRGTWGRLFDVRWAGDELSTGDTVPADGSRAWVKNAMFFLPNNGDAPVTA